ncbi:Shikimate kinase 1 [BD1-7 clade bacterium]|uniref:Shikimate kinase n=1 Tax=BD1-7 clade bacterium TaxID=2029982 RepID=A0A5S9Q8Z0_9GAMM|nr:Shikimate kinase 1 [BD1-7 clade bacterium]
MPTKIILVGPMGAGKTTIGRMLAQELGLPFKDVDHMVVEQAGADIPWIFDMEGELGFRKRETQSLLASIDGESAIIATGGGIVTQAENRKLLNLQSCVVYLATSVEQQYQRTLKDKNRPLLQQSDPRQVLEDLMAIRRPLYEEVADITIETDRNRPKAVVNQIISHWNKYA